MTEQEAYNRMVALWAKQSKGEAVDRHEVYHAEQAWVRLVRLRIGTSGAKRMTWKGGKR